MCCQRLKLWNTMPSWERNRCTCLRSDGISPPWPSFFKEIISPWTLTEPEVGSSSMLMQRRKVDLPGAAATDDGDDIALTSRQRNTLKDVPTARSVYANP